VFDLVHGVCQFTPYHVRYIHIIFNHLINILVCLYFVKILIEKYFHKGIKRVYIASQLIYAIGMLLMGYIRHRIGVIILSAVAGILYSTLFTIPFLLISKYHTSNTVCVRFALNLISYLLM
jgi:hypothetical protein